MSKIYVSSNKCCGTCGNWAGKRVAKSGNASVEVDSVCDRGKCYANVFCGVTQGQSSSEGVNCTKYQKWSALI